MCGIIGLLLAPDADDDIYPLLVDGLTVLQHRGQDAAGLVTADRQGRRLRLRKERGLVRDVFSDYEPHPDACMGLGHCRYPTAGSSSCAAEAQPLYTNTPLGICVAHNGNLTNTNDLTLPMRHVNTDSDSEVLLNWFAEHVKGTTLDDVWTGVEAVMHNCQGGYAGLFLVNGLGLVGIRDPHGIRPLVLGERRREGKGGESQLDYMLCSESVALDALGFQLVRDVRPGEAVVIDLEHGKLHTRMVHPHPKYHPCIFEYVYFARPDSIMDGVSVYQSRLNMGERLARKILKDHPDHGIDVVIPIPDTSRTAALQVANILQRPYREGFIKNRYIARTFIMPGQATRRKSVRLKLNPIRSEFAGRTVLLVDDSIVRGTTGTEIVSLALDAGARRVCVCSAAPPILYPNIYGIDIPTQSELIAFQRTEKEIAEKLGCQWVVYQDLSDLEAAVNAAAPSDSPLQGFETSCFSGVYVTGETMGDAYFTDLHEERNDEAQQRKKLRNQRDKKTPVTSCESLANDEGAATTAESSCEPP